MLLPIPNLSWFPNLPPWWKRLSLQPQLLQKLLQKLQQNPPWRWQQKQL